MSKGMKQLHSHSVLEGILKLPKHLVLVDIEFANLFKKESCKPFRYNGVDYLKVNILEFIRNGGVFKSFNV